MNDDLKIGIVDEPINSGRQDTLDLNRHADALTQFIRSCATPLTIGIQGEWGSGKTSLINSIWDQLAADSSVKQIWINSWENALLCTPEQTLVKITSEIFQELLKADVDKNRREKISNAASSVFKNALRVGAAVSLGAKAADIASEILDAEEKNGIKILRQNLVDLVEDIRSRDTNAHERVVVYIDDLDRLDPRNAVIILELLKNIFSVPHCVFVLAIDYQVVVKGLEGKFGPQTEDNEWEFRAFFDKIIQLPFMMPTGQYNIPNYITNLLKAVGYECADEIDHDILLSIVRNTTGGNPRALKRLANSVALIQIFDQSRSNELQSALTGKQKAESVLALLALQIAYPDIYDLLSQHPDIRCWDQSLAYSITGGKEESDDSFARDLELASQTDDFDEVWEQALYRICYPKPRYRARVASISQILGTLVNDVLKIPDGRLTLEIEQLLRKTSVTNVTSSIKSQASNGSWKTQEEKDEANELWNMMLDKLQTTQIFSKGSRSGSSGVIRLTDKRFPLATFVISQNKLGISLWINRGSIEENLSLFDALYSQREPIEAKSGLRFSWVRKDTSKRQVISLQDDACQLFNSKHYAGNRQVPERDGWATLLSWIESVGPAAEAAFISMLESAVPRNQKGD